jgi:hypothetical protein
LPCYGVRLPQEPETKQVEVRIIYIENGQGLTVEMHSDAGQKNSALAGGGVARALEPLEGGKGLIDYFIHHSCGRCKGENPQKQKRGITGGASPLAAGG